MFPSAMKHHRPVFILICLVLGLLATNCSGKRYYLLSPADDYSDDPSLSVRLVALQRARSGDTAITLRVENHTVEPLSLSAASIELVDADDQKFTPEQKLDTEVGPDASQQVSLMFKTHQAATGTFELRLGGLPVKVWPIIFSASKPPDFKATPEATPAGPGRPPGPRPM